MLTPAYGRIGFTITLGCILFVVLHLFFLIYRLIGRLQDSVSSDLRGQA